MIRIFLIATTISCIALSQACQAQQSGQSIQHHTGADQNQTNTSLTSIPEGKQQGTAKDQTRCDEPESNNGSDICAQWVAANAARKSAEIAQISLYWTIASFIALSLTLMATAWAAIASALAARAARQANAINQNTSEVDQRAWLAVKLDVLDNLNIDKDGGISVRVGAKITNIGKTPARKIHTKILMDCDSRYDLAQEKLEELALSELEEDVNYTRSLMPGQHYVREWAPSIDTVDKIFDGSQIVMPNVLVCVTYQTIFPNGKCQTALTETLGIKIEGGGYFPITYKSCTVRRDDLMTEHAAASIIS